nr:MAG TPA: hypothetical protein [Caudoviricetes sp.]
MSRIALTFCADKNIINVRTKRGVMRWKSAQADRQAKTQKRKDYSSV